MVSNVRMNRLLSYRVGACSISLGSASSSTMAVHLPAIFWNLASIFAGMYPWISAKCFVPDGFLSVSSISFATLASSCRASMSRLVLFAICATSFAFVFCLAASSLIFDSARAWAFEGTCGIPSGMANGFALKLLNIFSIFSESAAPPYYQHGGPSALLF